MKQNIESYEYRKQIGQIKYALIAPVITGTYSDDSITAYYKRISTMEIDWPDGTKKRFSSETIKYWAHLYRRDGIDGLIPHGRLDAGSVRKLNDIHKKYIVDIINQFPKITGVMIREKMIEEGLITRSDVSVDTIQRYIKNSGIRNGGNAILKERRSWEYARSCDGYEADTCHTLYIFDEDGIYRKTYLIAVIDNHSRMIVGAEFFFNDNSVNFQKVWQSAVLRYGRSKVMILDNGSSYKNKSTTDIEARLGTKIIYNKPYSPTGKAVIERFFLTIKMRWLNCEDGKKIKSLNELNNKLKRWVNEYNRTCHSSLNDDPNDNHTPLERYLYDMKDTDIYKLANKSPLEYESWVKECFLHEIARKVNGDSTVVINNISFDVSSVYIGQRVIIRYDPRKYDYVYLYDVYKKEKVMLVQTDRIENGKTRRTEIIY